jgi:hypothetical protein
MSKSRFITSFIIFTAGFVLSAVIDVRNLASPTKGTLSNSEASAQKTSVPQLWEYRVVTREHDDKKMDHEVNALGAQGFEVFQMTQSSTNSWTWVTILLRRPKQ